jgi:sulfur transfer protein SufE
MPWTETSTTLSANKTVAINAQDALHMVGYQPFLTLIDGNANNSQSRIQNADGKLVFYTQSALKSGLPTVIFNTLTGQPPPSAIEIHAQDGVQTVGYQPFLTLTDANAGYAKARVQNADGKLVFYTQSALNSGFPTVIFNTIAGQTPPSAIEIHAQDGVQTVGYQPFLTLTDANAGYAKARIQNANGGIILYTQGGIAGSKPAMLMDGPTGDVQVTGNLTMTNGNVTLSQGSLTVTQGDILLPGADCAEQFDTHDPQLLEPGTVVVINEEGGVCQSHEAYDTKVAGVVSGAGAYRPGIILDKQTLQADRVPVALVGKVYCNVDAQYSSIKVGDLLTTSPTPGYAMKAIDPVKSFGAVLGKALRPLAAGCGLIPVLIALQ